jgi:hypothetical protein
VGIGLAGVQVTCSDGTQKSTDGFSVQSGGGSMSKPDGYASIGVGSGTFIDRLYDPTDPSFKTFVGHLSGDITNIQPPGGLLVSGVTIQGSSFAVGVSFSFGPKGAAPVAAAPPTGTTSSAQPSSTPEPSQTPLAASPASLPPASGPPSGAQQGTLGGNGSLVAICASDNDCDPTNNVHCISGACISGLPTGVPLPNTAVYASTQQETFRSKANALAVFAQAAYSSTPPQVVAPSSDICDTYTLIGSGQGTTQTVAYVMYQGSKSDIVVAFRGTSSASDVLTDFSFNLQPCTLTTSCGQLHDGFLNAYLELQPLILGDFFAANSSSYVSVTGHSLGGALARIAAFDFTNSQKIPVQNVYTFGCPRVGDSLFEAKYQTILGPTDERIGAVLFDQLSGGKISKCVTYFKPSLIRASVFALQGETDPVTAVPFIKQGYSAISDTLVMVQCQNSAGGQCSLLQLHDIGLYKTQLKAATNGSCISLGPDAADLCKRSFTRSDSDGDLFKRGCAFSKSTSDLPSQSSFADPIQQSEFSTITQAQVAAPSAANLQGLYFKSVLQPPGCPLFWTYPTISPLSIATRTAEVTRIQNLPTTGASGLQPPNFNSAFNGNDIVPATLTSLMNSMFTTTQMANFQKFLTTWFLGGANFAFLWRPGQIPISTESTPAARLTWQVNHHESYALFCLVC